MNRLMKLYQQAVKDIYASMPAPMCKYEFYVAEASRIAIAFPQLLQIENIDRLNNMTDRERTSFVLSPSIK